jgi:hypothetical protein
VLQESAFRLLIMQSASTLLYTVGKEGHSGVAIPKRLAMEPEAITASGMLNETA